MSCLKSSPYLHLKYLNMKTHTHTQKHRTSRYETFIIVSPHSHIPEFLSAQKDGQVDLSNLHVSQILSVVSCLSHSPRRIIHTHTTSQHTYCLQCVGVGTCLLKLVCINASRFPAVREEVLPVCPPRPFSLCERERKRE